MIRPLTLVLLVSATSTLQAVDKGIEIRQDGRLFVLSPTADGARLMLTLDGHEMLFGECGDELRGQKASPKSVTASVVERNCGATVDFATHVQLQFGEDRESVAVFAGRVPVQLDWTDAGLRVRHAPLPSGRIYRKWAEALGTPVTFQVSGVPAPASEYLDFSSFNYGATGRAAGLPAELLLRVAGWSQEASGLHREQWGSWSDAEPYGDDPEGSRQIRNGIHYYEETQGYAP